MNLDLLKKKKKKKGKKREEKENGVWLITLDLKRTYLFAKFQRQKKPLFDNRDDLVGTALKTFNRF